MSCSLTTTVAGDPEEQVARLAARLPGLASGLALAVRPGGAAEARSEGLEPQPSDP
jgi:hypothetical protein